MYVIHTVIYYPDFPNEEFVASAAALLLAERLQLAELAKIISTGGICMLPRGGLFPVIDGANLKDVALLSKMGQL